MTIRAKILGGLGLLAAMAMAESLLVIYVQRAITAADSEQARTADVLELHGQAWRALVVQKADRRAFLLSREPVLESRLPASEHAFDVAVAQIQGAVLDDEQRLRLERLVRLVDEWREQWPAVRASAALSAVPPAAIVDGVDQRFRPIEAVLVEFEDRQRVLADAARARAERVRSLAGTTMLFIPGLALVFMAGMAVAVGRLLLAPLTQLTDQASRIARREVTAVEQTDRADEIGILQNAFASMTESLRFREGELTHALRREQLLAMSQAEAAARAELANADLHAILDTVPVGLIIRDGQTGAIRLQNHAAVELWGQEPEDPQRRQERWARTRVRTRGGKELPQEAWPWRRALAGERIVGEEFEIEREDGVVIPTLVSAAPLRDGHGNVLGTVVAFQDIARLRELDRLKDEFVSIVSHELRTPLTSIRGSLQLVSADPDAVPDPDHRHLVDVALSNCERLIRIINDILDISKIEAGRMTLQPRPVTVADLVRTSVESVAAIAEAARVHIDTRIAADLPPVVVDPDRMVQVIVNLLSNAVKFTPQRSQVVVEAASRGNQVAIAVSDQGAGIPPEKLEQLFQKFHQVDSSASRRKGGTGLGLSIAKALAEQHGGTVEVSSVVGRGTTFTVLIPAASPLVAPRPVHLSSSSSSSIARPVPKRVLIVDDDDDFRLAVRRQLEAAGYLVVEARDGEAALHVARQTAPDVMTVDLMMPGMDGWELIERLAADAALATIPVIVVSAVADRAQPLRGAAATLSKPIDRDGLLREVSLALGGRRDATVLIAEDDADLRQVLAQSLVREGYRVVQAVDGEDALAVFDRENADVVVLDIRMPLLDGFGVIRRLRDSARGQRVPIVVVTGSDGEGRSEVRAMSLGANAYLAKPVDAANLARQIEQVLTARNET
ncbi:MAG: response regulator [Acidobacteriota bacterium]